MTYRNNADMIKFHRDIFAGDYAIKQSIAKYIPRMDMQTDEEYDAYACRPVLSDTPGKILQQLVALSLHNCPQYIIGYVQKIVTETLVTGICGSLVLPEHDKKPIFYTADQILEYTMTDRLTAVTLSNTDTFPACYITLLDDCVSITTDVETKQLSYINTPLTEIPFVFHSRSETSPLSHLCSLALDHFRLMADYRNALHYSSLCTAYAAGFPKDKVLRLGDQSAWISDYEKATAAFLEFKPNCFPAFQTEIPNIETKMAAILETFCPNTPGHSPFKTILNNIEASLVAVNSLANRFNVTVQKYLHAFPDNIRTLPMTSDNITALTDAWKSGAINDSDYLAALKKGAVI